MPFRTLSAATAPLTVLGSHYGTWLVWWSHDTTSSRSSPSSIIPANITPIVIDHRPLRYSLMFSNKRKTIDHSGAQIPERCLIHWKYNKNMTFCWTGSDSCTTHFNISGGLPSVLEIRILVRNHGKMMRVVWPNWIHKVYDWIRTSFGPVRGVVA